MTHLGQQATTRRRVSVANGATRPARRVPGEADTEAGCGVQGNGTVGQQTGQPKRSGASSLAVAGPAVTAAVVALALHACLAGIQADHARSAALLRTGGVGADLISDEVSAVPDRSNPKLEPVESFRQWSFAVLRNPDIICTLLVGGDGALCQSFPAGFQFDADALKRLLESSGTRKVRVLLGAELESVLSVALPVKRYPIGEQVGILVLLGRPSPGGVASPWILTTAILAIGLLPLGLLSVFLGIRHQRRQARALFQDLLPSPGTSPGSWRATLPVGRQDEVGQIARVCADAHDELLVMRRQSAGLEREIDHRVAERVRQVDALLLRTQKEAWADSLTGLANRRLLDDQLEKVFERQRGNREDLTVIMFDVDHFKQFNDSKGHAAGDELLRFVGELLKTMLRAGDVAIRYGGDEFAVLLLGTHAADAAHLAQRIIKMFAQRTDSLPASPRVTVSAGVASMQTHGADCGASLLEEADKALYQAKRKGRNQVVISGRLSEGRSRVRPASVA